MQHASEIHANCCIEGQKIQRNKTPLRYLATVADEGFEPVKLEPADSHVGASVTGFISATVRAQQKFFVFLD